MKRILIGADIVPTEKNYEYFKSGNAETLLGGELKAIFDRADYRIFNLETPLTDRREPILKTGPNLAAPAYCIEGYRAMGIDLLAVANNHILDQGRAAFRETLALLTENGIEYIGGGLTREEAKKPKILELEGKRIGIFNACEHEFSWIDDYGIGANGFDPLESLDEIAALKAACDYLIVLYHGGREHYPYPSPLLQKTCRKIAEKGADLVICQHTHCIGAKEEWQGCEIIYGQGNALFDLEGREIPCWQTSILVELVLSDGQFSLDYIPIRKKGELTSLSHEPEILGDFHKRSEEIKEEGFVKRRYTEFVMSERETFDMYLRLFSNANNLGTKGGAGTRNLLTCDPHREFITTYVSQLHKLYEEK